MNKVTLTRLAVMDLGITYARRYEGTNKITHYKVGYSHTLVGIDPAQAVQDFIIANEGPTEFHFEELLPNGGTGLMNLESAASVLDTEDGIRSALQQKQYKHMVITTDKVIRELTLGERVFNLLGRILNPISRYLNRKILEPIQQRIYGVTPQDYYNLHFLDDDTNHSQSLVIAARLAKIKTIPILQTFERQVSRLLHPCTFLALSYEEGDEFLAEQILREDLRKFYEKDMILGHLMMPTRLALADIIGSGKRPMALCCFLFVDNYKIPGYNPLNTKIHSYVEGIRTAGDETNLSILPELDYASRYEIETIKVIDNEEKNHKAVVDAYLSQKAYIQGRSAAQKAEYLKKKEGK